MHVLQKFDSTESFDSESSLVENKSKFKENIELIQSHRIIKSMEIQMETLQAQCKAYEKNMMDVNELFKKECDENGIIIFINVYSTNYIKILIFRQVKGRTN